MQITERAQAALARMIRDAGEDYAINKPGLIWVLERSAKGNDPGPILADLPPEMIEKRYYSGIVRCEEFDVYVSFPPNLWERYKDDVLDVIDGNINFVRDFPNR